MGAGNKATPGTRTRTRLTQESGEEPVTLPPQACDRSLQDRERPRGRPSARMAGKLRSE